MTPRQITLVKNSWRTLRGLDPALIADLFYSRLFLEHPELRRLFPVNMHEQYQKLISTLNIIVARFDQAGSWPAELAALVQWHTQYGAKPEYDRYFGATLLWTLERCLGPDWTPEVADAWETFYRMIAETMINAAEPAPAQNRP